MDEKIAVDNIEETVKETGKTPDNDVIGGLSVTEDAHEEGEKPIKEENKKKKRKRIKLHERTLLNDIRFRGPLSYRHLRIAGWVFMAFMVLSAVVSLGSKINSTYGARVAVFYNAINFLGEFALPFFLIANFAVILNAKDGYKKMFITYSALIVLIYLLFVIVVNHYVIGILTAILGDRASGRELFNNGFALFSKNGYLAVNVFIDLMLCTAFTYFLNYRPQKYFKGGWLVAFRLLAVLPVLYEVGSLVLKYMAYMGKIRLSIYVFPLLSTKPPMMFVAFIVMVLFVKVREWIFLSRKKTREEYREFLDTNVNSLHFSITTAVIFLIVGLADVLILTLVPLKMMNVPLEALESAGADAVELFAQSYESAFKLLYSMGFGKSIILLLLIPVVFLFSYTRTHKKSKLPIDLIISAVGFVIVALTAVEGSYQVVCGIFDAIRSSVG